MATTTLSGFFAHNSSTDTGGNFAGLGLPLNKVTCLNDLFCTPNRCDPDAIFGDANERRGTCVADTPPDCGTSDQCTNRGCSEADRACFSNDTSGRCGTSDQCHNRGCDTATGCFENDTSGRCGTSDQCTNRACDNATGCTSTDTSGRCGTSDQCHDRGCDTATGCFERAPDPLPPACTPSLVCRVTGGGIVCAGQGQCCNSTTGECAANGGSGTNSVTCTDDSTCTAAFGAAFPTCTFCTTDPSTGADIQKATFGGQVGAPFVIPGCHDNANCVQGNWTHQRHKKHGSLHGPDFYNMVCRCDNGDGTTTNGVCGDRSNGPEPPAAPANIACFTGTALWNPTAGRRTIPVAFRVEIEDRGEPGGGRNAGNLDDVYRIRIWFGSNTANAVAKAEAACCSNDIATVIGSIGAPDVLDGGNLIHGNLQIHKLTGNHTNNPPFPDQCFAGGGEPN